MVQLLNTFSDWTLFFLLSAFFILFSIACVHVVRYFIPLQILRDENPVLGSIGSIIGIIYGVLAGLTALFLINNVTYTADAVLKEASASANIYRDTSLLGSKTSASTKAKIEKYLHHVIDVEWPKMRSGKKILIDGDLIIDSIANEIILYSQVDRSADKLVLHDLLEDLKSLYDARHLRIHMASSSLNVEIWVVLLVGTFLTLAINCLFGMNYYLHLFAVSAAALLAASIIFLILTLDNPYQGEFAIQPDAFNELLLLIQQQKT